MYYLRELIEKTKSGKPKTKTHYKAIELLFQRCPNRLYGGSKTTIKVVYIR